MNPQHLVIPTEDGRCSAWLLKPAGSGCWPGVILYMDALAIRPVLLEQAERLADAGYVVLLPDLFYRFGPYAPLDPKIVFAGDFRANLGPMLQSTDVVRASRDTSAFIAMLRSRPEVSTGPLGVVGYCMGGGMALTAAADFPEEIGAVASFHGGQLATESPLSPHRRVPDIKAEVYLAVADVDPSCPEAMVHRLEAALTEGKVRYRIELFHGARHGWTMPDLPAYSELAARRAQASLLSLLERALL